MTLFQSFIGSIFEFTSILIFMSCFNSRYLHWIKTPVVVLSAASVVILVEYMAFPSMMQYVIFYSFVICLCSIVFRHKLNYTAFELIISNLAVITIELALIVLHTALMPGALTFGERLVHLGIVLLTAIAVARNNKLRIKLRAFYEKYVQIIFLVATNLIAAFILIIFVWDTDNQAVYDNIGFLALFVAAWMAVNLYLLHIAIKENRSKTAIQAYKKYAETTEALADNLYAERHEYNRHLQAILNLCDSEDSKKGIQSIAAYIGELKDRNTKKKSEFSSIHIKDKLIAGVIYAKQQDILQHGISLYCSELGAGVKLPLLNYETVEIIENLLDNAIEYLKESDDAQKKRIYLELGTQQNQSYIKIKNDYYGQEAIGTEATRKGYSTKQGKKRGYGLYNVKQIVAKYKGDLNIFIEGNFLNIEVYFNHFKEKIGAS